MRKMKNKVKPEVITEKALLGPVYEMNKEERKKRKKKLNLK